MLQGFDGCQAIGMALEVPSFLYSKCSAFPATWGHGQSYTSLKTFFLFFFQSFNIKDCIYICRVSFRGGRGGGGAFAPPLEILLYIYCIVQHVALAPPGMRKQLFCPPLSKILNAALHVCKSMG